MGWGLWLAGSNGWDVGVLEKYSCRKLSCWLVREVEASGRVAQYFAPVCKY